MRLNLKLNIFIQRKKNNEFSLEVETWFFDIIHNNSEAVLIKANILHHILHIWLNMNGDIDMQYY